MEKVPGEVVLRVEELVLDTIGVVLVGSIQLPAEIIIDYYVRHLGGNPQATILGRGFKTAAPIQKLFGRGVYEEEDD